MTHRQRRIGGWAQTWAFLLLVPAWSAAPAAGGPTTTTAPATRPAAAAPAPPGGPGAANKLPVDPVELAIDKATKYLLAQQKGDGSWGPQGDYVDAPTALAVYALLRSGMAQKDPRIEKALTWLQANRTNDIYCLGLRCMAWDQATWWGWWGGSGNPWVQELRKDATGIIRSIPDPKAAKPMDLEQALWVGQGLLTACDRNEEIPRQAWVLLLDQWTRAQRPDGGWGGGGASTARMTAGGVAALQRMEGILFSDRHAKVGLPPYLPQQIAGMGWMDKQFGVSMAGGLRGRDDLPSCLFVWDQAARTTGRWRFGGQDLYDVGAVALLRAQRPDGSWAGEPAAVPTAYALAFLTGCRRGSRLLQLEYPGDWNNRPQGLANLGRWLDNCPFFMRLYPGIADVNGPVEAWDREGRFLFITGSLAPLLAGPDIDRLRLFVLRGGTIFSCTEGNGAGFAGGIRNVYARMFPQYPLAPCGPGHPIWRNGKPNATVGLFEVSNGIRPLAVHCDNDLPRAWQLRLTRSESGSFDAVGNMVRYVTDGKWGAWPNLPFHRLPWPAEAKFDAKSAVTLVRLAHAGNCDPEPLAYERFSRMMGRDLRVKVNVVGPIPIANLPAVAPAAKLAVLTGTGQLNLAAGDDAVLRQFIAGGGTLLVEAAGGDKAFAASAREMVNSLVAPQSLKTLDANCPLYEISGSQISEVRYTRAARVERKIDTQAPRLCGVKIGGRVCVLFSEEDLTLGLLGLNATGCAGYEPDSAFAIMRNIVLQAGGAKKAP